MNEKTIALLQGTISDDDIQLMNNQLNQAAGAVESVKACFVKIEMTKQEVKNEFKAEIKHEAAEK